VLAPILQIGGFVACVAGVYLQFGGGVALMAGGLVVFVAGGLEGRRRGSW